MRMVGPNTMGVINTAPRVRLHASFTEVMPAAGRVGVSSQSGTIGAAVLDELGRHGLGVSTFVAAGNKADVSGNDLLQYWEQDDRTDVVLLYLESFGNPRNFARIARRVSIHTPIVAVKAGRLRAARRGARRGRRGRGGGGRRAPLPDRRDPGGDPRAAGRRGPGPRRPAPAERPAGGRAVQLLGAGVPRGRRLHRRRARAGDAVGRHRRDPRGGAPQRRPPEQPARADLGGRARRVRRGDGRAGRRPARSTRSWCCTHRPSPTARATWPGPWPAAVSTHGATTVVASFLGPHEPGCARRPRADPGPSRSPRPPRMALGRVARYAKWRRQPAGLVPELDGAADAVGRPGAGRRRAGGAPGAARAGPGGGQGVAGHPRHRRGRAAAGRRGRRRPRRRRRRSATRSL